MGTPHARPEKIPIIDGLLAATALRHRLTVVTRNESGFAATAPLCRIPGRNEAGGVSERTDRELPVDMGTAREAANGIAFLASDEASYITGTCLFIDGGQTAS